MDVPSAKTERIAEAAFDAYARAGMPSESSVSFPVPVPNGPQLEAHVFVSVSRPTRKGHNTQLFRPTTKVRLDWESERVLAVHPPEVLADHRPSGLLLPAAFAVEPTEESDMLLWEARHGLSLLLDEVGPIYGRGQDEPGLRGRCRDAFRQIVPPVTSTLYEELNPAFFRWLDQGAVPSQHEAGWHPSHVVPAGGVEARATPDPGAPVVAVLEPGLPLQVAEVAGAWTRVIAANGWTGWVDGRLLAPRT